MTARASLVAPRVAGPHADWLRPDWLRQDGFLPGIGALMTTRAGGLGQGAFDSMNLRDGIGDDPAVVARNRDLLTTAIGAEPVWLDQVHGTRVVRIGHADAAPDAARHAADASVTTEPGIACAVQVADCLPVLFAVPGRAVGAAHAGWRGLAAGVLEATLAAVCEAGGCAPGDVSVWLGACIGPRRFQVGADVLDAFSVPRGERASARGGAERFVPESSGKWLADLPLLATDRLRAAGVHRISGGDWCTVAHPSRFFSYRRDGITGRMAALIWRLPER